MTRPVSVKPSSPLLVLASASPRRRQLLKQAGLTFRVLDSGFAEGRPHGKPESFTVQSALGKARAAAARLKQPAWVLGADTVVAAGSNLFGKPRDRAEACRMIRSLAGRVHRVVTGVAFVGTPGGRTLAWAESTRVRMRALSPVEIEAYLASGEWRGKAGAYGIQGRAGAFVTRVEGCYFNVVGLPLGAVCAQWHRLKGKQP